MNLTSKREVLKKIYEPLGLSLAYLNIPPNVVTLFSVIAGVSAAYAFYTHHVLTGATLLFISGLLDLADGIVARTTGRATKFGAVLDWLADKFIDGLVLGAVWGRICQPLGSHCFGYGKYVAYLYKTGGLCGNRLLPTGEGKNLGPLGGSWIFRKTGDPHEFNIFCPS